jgi:Glyoxalase-like domain
VAELFQLVVDCRDPLRLVRFWGPLIGYAVPPAPEGHATWREWYLSLGVPPEEIEGDGTDWLVPPAGAPGLPIWFQPVLEPKTLKNRLHLDLRVTPGRSVPRAQRRATVEAEVERLVGLGATLVRLDEDEAADHVFAVMGDPEGNEFCLV